MIDDDVPWRRIWDESSRAYSWQRRLRPRPFPVFQDVGRPQEPRATDLRDLVIEPSVPLSPPPAAAPREDVAQIALRLVTDDGVPLPNVALGLRSYGAGEDWIDVTTDADGIVELERPEGTHEIQISEVPLALPAAPPDAAAPARTLLLERNREIPFFLSTVAKGADPKVVAIRRPRFTEVLIDGYALGASVMRWGGTRSRLTPEGLPVVGSCRAALRQALWLARGRQAFVVGHTDPQGSESANAAVALERAKSVFLYASGDLDGWADHAAAHGTDTDRACAAIACARIVGEPPPGLQEAEAVRRTLDKARAIAGIPPGDDAAGDYRAAAALYDLDLCWILRTDLAGLASMRALVRWFGNGTGHGELGERFPRPLAELDPSSMVGPPYTLACRRSAIVVMADADAAALEDAENLDELYDGTFGRVTIDPPAEWRVKLAVLDDRLEPLPHGRAWIGTDTGVIEHTADASGIVAFDALLGERIEVVVASRPAGDGTMVNGGTER